MCAEYASKGVAGTGLGLGIAGTALGLLNNNGNGGGLLGGLLGGWNGFGNQAFHQMAGAMGMNALMEKDAEIAKLKAEKYSDKNDIEVYAQTRKENQDLADRLLGNWLKPLADEAAANKVTIARLEEKMCCMEKTSHLREENVRQRIDCVANEAAHGIHDIGMGLAALRNTVSGITRTIVPQTAICPPVMPRYNSFEVPTDTAPATQPINGTVNVANI